MGAACAEYSKLQKEQTNEAPDKNSDPHEVSGCYSGVSQQTITAEEVERSQLEEILRARVGASAEAEAYISTLQSCLDLIINGVGGIIIIVVHDDVLGQRLELGSLDGGALYRVMSSVTPNVNDDVDSFKTLMDVLTRHNDRDRWTHADVQSLASSFGKGEDSLVEDISKLEEQPKDGAILLSHAGAIKGASMHIKYKSRMLVMKKTDGTSAGTRHASSLGMAEMLGTVRLDCPGIVFTRSDGGGGHAFIPQPYGNPQVLHFKTIHALSQEEMFVLFKDRMGQSGKLMLKKEPALIRPAVKGEQVVTVVGGRVTSNVTVGNDTSYVVQASTPDQEHYVLSQEKFLKNYMPQGTDLDGNMTMATNSFMRSHSRLLKSRGFKLYHSRPNNLRCLYTVTAQDIQDMGINLFESSWGAIQPVQEGDYLASAWPQETATEIYLMPKEVVGTYKQVKGSGEDISGDDDPVERTLRPDALTQKEMLDLFGERLVKEGQLMIKKATSMIRPAVLDETIVTCVSGRVISCVKVTDDTSKVMLGDHHELVVISQDFFAENFEPEGWHIPGKSSVEKLLVSQGFKVFKPRAVSVLVYKLSAEDVRLVPNGFVTSNGTVQALQEGDYLAVPDGSRKTEVYTLAADEILGYGTLSKSSRNVLPNMFKSKKPN